MGLKGLREFDRIENVGEEEPKGLLFPVEEKVPTEPAHSALRWTQSCKSRTEVENRRKDGLGLVEQLLAVLESLRPL